MIYFVDEDVSQIAQWASILRMKGMQTHILRDADAALEYLSKKDDIELVFIDVMLAGRSNGLSSNFDRAKTDDYCSTGLELLKALVACKPKFFPSRAILLSQTGQSMILQKIEDAIIDYKYQVPFWKKGKFVSVMDFASLTENYLKQKLKA